MTQSRAEYLERMETAGGFARLARIGNSLEPKWRPGEEDVDGFCHDEVVRQYHDPRIESDGGCRVRWMRGAWDFALEQLRAGYLPDPRDVEKLGRLTEPKVNALGFRTCRVWIGGREGAPPGSVPRLVSYLAQRTPAVEPGEADYEYFERAVWAVEIAAINDRGEVAVAVFEDVAQDLIEHADTVDDWYLAYEFVHPFGDGNGRTGKILHNWLNQSLCDPVLVPDYFGMGNP